MVAQNGIAMIVTMLVVIAAGGLVLLMGVHGKRSARRPHQAGEQDQRRTWDEDPQR